MADAVVHVFDPGEPGKAKDFICSIHALTHGMRYFKDVLQKSVESRVTPVEISVHCDVAIFEWLLGYCNGRVSRDRITEEGVLPLLIASNFLQMDSLVGDCLSFMAANLVAVALHHQHTAPPGQQGGDLTALPLDLLSRLARLVPEWKLEELAALTPGDVRARHLPLVNRLYKYKLEGCLRDLRTTVARCSACQGLFSLAERAKLDCPGPALTTQQRRSSPAVHIPDASWRLQEYLSSLRAQQIAWRGIYWHVWGIVHVLYCHTCMQFVPACDLRRCTYHPQAPVFPAAAVAAAVRQHTTGVYPCCGVAVTRGADPRVGGCCAREHRLISSGQGPGAPLPAGLTPELLSSLQHCAALFTNPAALLVRETTGGGGGDLGVALVRPCAPGNGGRASVAVAEVATSGGAVSPGALCDVMPPCKPSGTWSRSGSAEDPAMGLDADGHAPPAVQAASSSSAVASAAATALRRAAAATAAALGYSLKNMDSGTSGPSPPQTLLPPPPPLHHRSQSSLGTEPAKALPGSPVHITGDPQVDAWRVAVAVARRLSRSSGGAGSRAAPSPIGESLAYLAPKPAPLDEHLHRNNHSDLNHLHHRHVHQQQQVQAQQRTELQLHNASSRRPLLDTARSFTSLAALQQQLVGDMSVATAASVSMAASQRPPLPLAATLGAAQSGPGDDWDRPPRGAAQKPCTPSASLRLLLKSTSTLQPTGISTAVLNDSTATAAVAGGSGAPISPLQRYPPHHTMTLVRSPRNRVSQAQPQAASAKDDVGSKELLRASGHLTAPPPSPVAPAVAQARGRLSPDPRDTSLSHGAKSGGSRRMGEQSQALEPQRSLSPQGESHWRQQQQQTHPGSMVNRALGRTLIAHSGSNAVTRLESMLPPRPGGQSASQPRDSGASMMGRFSGDGGEEDDDDRPPGRAVVSRRGNAASASSGRRAAGICGSRMDANPLQHSVQAVLTQQRLRWKELQEEQVKLQQQEQQQGQVQQPRFQQAYRQRIGGSRARQVGSSNSSCVGEEAAAVTAAAAQQERQVLIEQYKTQKVLSPRPRHVHMIAIAELPSGPCGDGCGSNTPSPLHRSQPGPSSFDAAAAVCVRHSWKGAANGAYTRVAAAAVSSSVTDVMGACTSSGSCGGATGLFAMHNEDADGSVLPTLSGSPSLETSSRAATANMAEEFMVPTRGRKLRMELLYEDDNYRMDLLVKHLLACRPSHRLMTHSALSAHEPHKPFRGRSLTASSARGAGGTGIGRGRPVSAAAATNGSRSGRPRSHSISHLQRLHSVYLPAAMSGRAAFGYSGGGGGYSKRGAGSGAVDSPAACRTGAESVGGGEVDCTVWNMMAVGVNGASSGAAARRSQDVRPLSAPRIGRYT